MDGDRCPTCLYGDKCSERFPDCDFYSPIDEISEEEMLCERMNTEYLDFREEWFEYTDENGE